ncbi:hypothetical protein [Tellurirhabdus bombi]|uniref:hypothetical protein n=1 Tax=Tellurirhabdus bombi TaxID=2907205 RepID=UPI001F43B780|nr:hypothetical protein [Tellurirhabdus bombi]
MTAIEFVFAELKMHHPALYDLDDLCNRSYPQDEINEAVAALMLQEKVREAGIENFPYVSLTEKAVS